MSILDNAERLKRALYHGYHDTVEALLSENPDLADANLGLQIALYDVDAVRSAISQSPSAATSLIGVRAPILHLAYSQYFKTASDKHAAMLEIAELLVANGADVNDGYAPEPGADHKISALYGALGHAGNMSLAEWLLEHGAAPDDSESLYHATELGHLDGLKLLMKYGVQTSGTNALPRALDFNNIDMVRLLLEYGVDPNEAVNDHPSGQNVDSIPALHQAARRGCSGDIAALILKHGGDPDAIWQGHSAYATACIHGNHEVAAVLENSGAGTKLSEIEQTLADCAHGRSPHQPLDMTKLNDEDRGLLVRLTSGLGTEEHLKSLIDAGFDPNATDGTGLTPIQTAGWHGDADKVRFYLAYEPDLNHVNGYGGNALETVIHGSDFSPQSGTGRHVICAELLLNAGAEVKQSFIEGYNNPGMIAFLSAWVSRTK